MKKQLLIAGGILLSTLGFSQEKFYSNNFTKVVTELNTTMKTVGFTTVLPSDYKKYKDIVVVIDDKDEGLNDYYSLNFYYNILPTTSVPSGGKVKYVIESGSDKSSDFTSLMRSDLDEEFEVFYSTTYKARTYRYQTIAIKVMGRIQDGMHWVNEVYVPKWIYKELSFTEIKLDLGEPEPNFTTNNGLLTYQKYNGGKTLTKIYTNKDSEDIKVVYEHGQDFTSKMTFSIYEIIAGEIKQETFDMGGPKPKASSAASVDDMIIEMKLNLKKQLVKSSCYNDARSVKIEGQRIAESKISEGIYKPYMLDAGAKTANAGTNALGSFKSIGGQFVKPKGGSDKYNKFVNSVDSKLNWIQKKLGSTTFDFLELDLYNNKQCQSSASSKSQTIKEDQQGKTQKVIIFIGKINGKLYAGSFTKSGKEDMNAEDLKFKDFILSTFKVNK